MLVPGIPLVGAVALRHHLVAGLLLALPLDTVRTGVIDVPGPFLLFAGLGDLNDAAPMPVSVPLQQGCERARGAWDLLLRHPPSAGQ